MPDEKFDEKEMEKREEKAPEEKSWEEKYRRDPVSSVAWAAILIWAGLVLLAGNLGMLDWLEELIAPIAPAGEFEAWSLIFFGAAGILLLSIFIRLLVPEYRRQISGSLFLAFLLAGIGLGNIFGWDIVWPLILVALGISLLLRGLLRGV